MKESIQLSLAVTTDAQEICELMNSAYRGEEGWTTEADLVSGSRSTVEQIRDAISDNSNHFLVFRSNGKILSCINIESTDGVAHIGSFAVAPALQGTGIGDRTIAMAEQYAKEVLSATRFSMLVLLPRKELIAFYERRGYRRTGRISPFPTQLNVGHPKIAELMVEELEKLA